MIFYAKNGWYVKYNTIVLTTGDDLSVTYDTFSGKVRANCRFIKTSRKGFNIVDLDTNRCILKRPIYAKDMGNKEFPLTGPITSTFYVPNYIRLTIKPKDIDKTA